VIGEQPFAGYPDPAQSFFIIGARRDLQTDRQALFIEPAGDDQHRLAGDIEWHGHAGIGKRN
jgi:hypothetical protein